MGVKQVRKMVSSEVYFANRINVKEDAVDTFALMHVQHPNKKVLSFVCLVSVLNKVNLLM